jgi:hypothetical protein
VYALLLALGIANESELPLASVLLQATRPPEDYLNNGDKVRLNGARAHISVRTVVRADPDEHDPETYAKLLGARFVAPPVLWRSQSTGD